MSSPPDNVVRLWAANQLAPTPELQAQYLEYLAQQVREGELVLDRAVLLYDSPNGADYIPFGQNTSILQLVGLCEFGKRSVMRAFDDA